MNKRFWNCFCIVLCFVFALTGCSGDTTNGNGTVATDQNDPSAGTYTEPVNQLEDLTDIDTGITDILVANGYSLEHATEIHKILNTIGIDSIEVENMTGKAEEGLNSIVCYPNGYSDRDRRFYFTTDNGELFYAGFLDEDLYDSSNGGDLKKYSDVHVPEKEVTMDTYAELQQLATEAVKNCLNYPDTAHFSMLNWAVGRSDEHYKIVGNVTAKNGFGTKEDISFSVWFKDNGEEFLTEGVAFNGIRIK